MRTRFRLLSPGWWTASSLPRAATMPKGTIGPGQTIREPLGTTAPAMFPEVAGPGRPVRRGTAKTGRCCLRMHERRKQAEGRICSTALIAARQHVAGEPRLVLSPRWVCLGA